MLVNIVRAHIIAASLVATPVAGFWSFPNLSFFKQAEPATTWLPQETGSFLDDGQGVSPRPTALPTRPQYGEFDLFKRLSGYTMGTDTCGFVASEWSNAFTCVRVGGSCTNDGTFIGCCTKTGRDCYSTIKTTCIDYSASLTGACDNRSGFNTLCCADVTAKYCHSYTFSTTATPGKTLTMIDCDITTGTDLLLDYPPTFTKTSDRTTTRTRTTTSIVIEPSSTSSSTTPSSSSSSTASTTPTPTPTQSSDPGPAPAPVGAIVGGVVGGLAGVGLIVLAALFLWRRSKDKEEDHGAGGVPTTQTSPSNQPLTHPSPSSPPAGTDSSSNPHYSYQSTPATMYGTPQQGGMAYAVPGAGHQSMYGSPPMQQTSWDGATTVQQQPAQYPITSYGDVNKTPSPIGAGTGPGVDQGVQQQQQQQPPIEYQYGQQHPQQAPYMQTQGPHRR